MALHNALLEIDGLDEHWKDGAAGVWEGEEGLHSQEDADAHAITRNDDITRRVRYVPNDSQPHMYVPTRGTKFEAFRQDLIHHFTYLFQKKKVQWPSRSGNTEWVMSTNTSNYSRVSTSIALPPPSPCANSD